MKRLTLFFLSILLFISGLLLSGCHDEVDTDEEQYVVAQVNPTIAVILPLDELNEKTWKVTAKMFLENLQKAQLSNEQDTIVYPNIEFHDENTEDLSELAQELADRDEVKLVIGPFENEHVLSVSTPLYHVRKPVIAPRCTSSNICRQLAGREFFWTLCESDVTQLRILLNLVKPRLHDGQCVNLITSESETGQTFIDWAAYEAIESGVELNSIWTYPADASDEEIASYFAIASVDDTPKVVICAPTNEKEAKVMMNAYANTNLDISNIPIVLMTDRGFSRNLASSFTQGFPYEVLGTAPMADPSRGFNKQFIYYDLLQESVFNLSSPNAALFYDALLIGSLACIEMRYGLATNIRKAISDIVASSDNGVSREEISGWSCDDMYRIISQLIQDGRRFDINGASGAIHFDSDIQSSSTRTIYALWECTGSPSEDNPYTIYDYISKDGTTHTASNSVLWNNEAKVVQDAQGKDVEYDEAVKSQWALLVSGSTGWDNYRHTADVMDMYRLLRKMNYPADHIVVVANRDLCSDKKNVHQGTIINWKGEVTYVSTDAEDKIDYQMSDLPNGVQDIFNILNGTPSGKVQKVLHPDKNSNVLVYWSGHGNRGYFNWGGEDSAGSLNKQALQSFMEKYQEDNMYRKMLWITEPCYSSSVAQAVYDGNIDHTLFIASALDNEQSLGANSDADMNIWLSDLFSKNVVSLIENNPKITYFDLYNELVRKTYGSHPNMFGADTFDNLLQSSPYEFFNYSSSN